MAAHPVDLDRRRRPRRPAPRRRVGGRPRRARRRQRRAGADRRRQPARDRRPAREDRPTRRRSSSTATTTSRASATSARGPRRRSSPRSATAACTRAAPPTTRATSGRCCTPPARWRARASCRSTCASSSRARRRRARESITEWIRADERGADAAIVFDSGMVDAQTPAITVGLRGMAMAQIEVRTGVRDLHSGMYGGSVLNALHVLHGMLAQVVPGPDGTLRDELRAGILPPAEAERIAWERLPPGSQVLSEVGGREAYAGAAAEYYERNGADASLDINQFSGGEPRTLVPARRPRRRLAAARARPARGRHRPRARAAAARGRAPGRRRQLQVAPRRPVAVRARPAGARAGRAGDRARHRHGAGARALRRLDPGRRRVRGARDPDHRERLRAARRRHPRAQRVVPAGRASSSASAPRASC